MLNNLQIFGLWVGLLGGFSGFLALFLQAWSTYSNAPRVKVKLTYAVIPSNGKKFYSIEVINKGGKPITINNLGIRFKNKMHSSFGLYPTSEKLGNDLPFRIDSHASQNWLVGEESTKSGIQELLVVPKFHAYILLATGKTKKSKKLKVQI